MPGLAGGLAFALAAATAARVDTFDPLFPVAGALIAVWSVAVGVMAMLAGLSSADVRRSRVG